MAFYGVTREPFIVFSATCAQPPRTSVDVLPARRARERLPTSEIGLAVLLVFIGAKFMLTEVVHIGRRGLAARDRRRYHGRYRRLPVA
jgi:predicted tellurium resistance membrane protein TerC